MPARVPHQLKPCFGFCSSPPSLVKLLQPPSSTLSPSLWHHSTTEVAEMRSLFAWVLWLPAMGIWALHRTHDKAIIRPRHLYHWSSTRLAGFCTPTLCLHGRRLSQPPSPLGSLPSRIQRTLEMGWRLFSHKIIVLHHLVAMAHTSDSSISQPKVN